MDTAAEACPRIAHRLPGRVRFHSRAWRGVDPRSLIHSLTVPGVRAVSVNPITGSVVVHYDETRVRPDDLLGLLISPTQRAPAPENRLSDPENRLPDPENRLSSRAVASGQQQRAARPPQRIRFVVPGLEKNDALARHIVAELTAAQYRAEASSLTGRVLIETTAESGSLEDALRVVRALAPPPTPRPAREPEDVFPRRRGHAAARLAAVGVGLAVVAGRAWSGTSGTAAAVKIAAGIALVQGIPPLNRSLEKTIGRSRADLAFVLSRAAVLALAGSPLGLVVIAAEALLELSLPEVDPRERPAPHLGEVVELGENQRLLVEGEVLSGRGTAIAADGLPVAVAPGSIAPAGARLHGGPFRLRPLPIVAAATTEAVDATDDVADTAPLAALLSLGFATSVALVTRSFSRGIVALLLTSPRANNVGRRAVRRLALANLQHAGISLPIGASQSPPPLPHALIVVGSRVLTDGCTLVGAEPATADVDPNDVIRRAGALATAAGNPWGAIANFRSEVVDVEAWFDGAAARGRIDGVSYRLAPATMEAERATLRLGHPGRLLLRLEREGDGACEGTLIVEPAVAPAARELVRGCRRAGVDVLLDAAHAPAAAAHLAEQLQIGVTADSLTTVRQLRATGRVVAVLADSLGEIDALTAANVACVVDTGAALPRESFIGVSGLQSVTRLIDIARRSAESSRDVTGLSTLGALAGGGWGSVAAVNLRAATMPSDLAALAGLAATWMRLYEARMPDARGRLEDPRPERWAELTIEDLLLSFGTTAEGLGSGEAAARRKPEERLAHRHELWSAIRESAISPLTAFVGGALGLTLLNRAHADAAVMATTLVLNIAVGAWQSYRVGNVQSELERLGRSSARALRDGKPVTISTDDVVPGDVLVLGPGERIIADARVLQSAGFEVDESPLTGESLPVRKDPDAVDLENRVVLDGTDVLVGYAKVLVVAVGSDTRLGAMARAVAETDGTSSPLADRLGQLFRQVLPVTLLGGAAVTASGVLRGGPLLAQTVMGASIALAALPEALPILAGMGQAAAARRLSRRNVLVRRSAAVEALGRVDVACVDKTGTLTENRLEVRRVATMDRDLDLEREPAGLIERTVLLSAALASPHPDAHDAHSHSTDVAVLRAAVRAGLDAAIRAPRQDIARFDQARPFHAAVANGRLHVKGAPEAIASRCTAVRVGGVDRPAADEQRNELLNAAERLAHAGYRVLLVAEGAADQPPEDPTNLVALGLLGIHDPLRKTVPAAVERCHAAGVRVIMLTGDHPATARRVALEAGLLDGGTVLTGPTLAHLPDAELDEVLENVTVIARATPLDKVRIIESLRRRGHTIAMTGDGVNDAAALRLADVGVAMGKVGTEVARQAADVIVRDDDFSSLVEALVEGRSFWRNLRRSIGLLLGGNFGELTYMVAGSVFGLGGALTVRQILATNLITDALPAFAVAVQEPEHRRLDGLEREGAASLGKPLRDEILRRTVATAVPALGAYVAMAAAGASLPHARAVGFSTIVSSQLALTVQSGRAQGSLTRPVVLGVGVSAAALLALLTVPPLRTLFELTTPPPLGWLIVGSATAGALLLGRAAYGVPQLPAPARIRAQLGPGLVPVA